MDPAQFTVEEDQKNSQNILVYVGIGVVVLVLLSGTVFAFIKHRRSQQIITPSVVNTTMTDGIEGKDVVSSTLPNEVVDVYLHDKDRDGILDEEEEQLGTSDFDYDSDGDGVSDFDEITIWKTDPTDPDSDGDGFQDGYEILSGYNPAGAGVLE